MIIFLDNFTIAVLVIITLFIFIGGALGFFSWANMRKKTHFLDYCNRRLGGDDK